MGRRKSCVSPFTPAANTSCARRGLILSAICKAVVPLAYSLTEPSGKVIFIIFFKQLGREDSTAYFSTQEKERKTKF
ncbi:hypothetical protein Barb7_03002 [Bacteroidales bacterium Barb7]|nr:hypothetical protein Barb7_03002 [Bacteroidales bacterium Barb7]